MDSMQGSLVCGILGWYCLVLAKQKAGRCGRSRGWVVLWKIDVILREDKVAGLELL